MVSPVSEFPPSRPHASSTILRILLLAVLIANTIPEAPADAPRQKKAATPTPKATGPGDFKKNGQKTLPRERNPAQERKTEVSGLDYEPRRTEKFDKYGKPTGSNLLSNRINDVQFRLRIKHASGALDDWARKVEEFGNVTMSSPILTQDHGAFEFAIKDGAEEFFKAAKNRKDGGAAAVLAIVNQFSASGQATFDPLSGIALQNTVINANAEQQLFQRQSRANIEAQIAKENAAKMKLDATTREIQAGAGTAEQKQKDIADAKTAYSDAIKGTATAPTPTTPELNFPDTLKGPSDTEKAAAQKEAEATAAAFKPFTDAVLAGENPAFFPKIEQATDLPDRVAMIDAAGTNTVKAIFKILGNPNAAMQFDDKAVLFATVTVAVNPGWRTKKDFAADISGQASYRMVKARTDVVDAFKSRIPVKYKKCILENHGFLVEAAEVPELTKGSRVSAADVRQAKKELEEAQLKDQEASADNNLATQKVANAKALAVAPINKALQARDELIETLKNQAVAEVVAHNISPEIAPNLATKENITAADGQNLASVVVETLEKAKEIAEAPEVTTDSSRLRYNAKIMRHATTVLDAMQKAADTYSLPEAYIPKLASKEAAKLTVAADKMDAKGDKVDNKKSTADSVKEAEKNYSNSLASNGGAFGAGDGAGDVGDLKVTDTYFDRVSFDKQPPLVAGISPLMETQVLDLKDRFGRQDQITIALAAAFRQNNVKGAASVFERFMKTQTKSANTLSSLPVVNTYSASGGLFGFQVGPRLRALEDPAARKSGSANVLDRQSFPAVLIIGIDRADLSPRICRDYDGKYYLFEPQLVIKQTSRWNPLDGHLFTPFKTTWWNPFAWHNARYSERERVDDLLNVADNFRDLTQWLVEESTRTSAHANGRRFSDGFAGSGEPQDDEMEGWSKDSRRKAAAAKNPLCEDSEAVIYNDDFTRHAYTDVVQSLVRRRNALQELSTGSESRQYLPLALLKKKKTPPAEPVKEPRLVDLVPPSIAVMSAAGAVVAASDIARIKQEALSKFAAFDISYLAANTFAAATVAGINKNRTEEATRKATAKLLLPPPAANTPQRDPSDTEVTALLADLLDRLPKVSAVTTFLTPVNTRMTELKAAINASTLVVADLDRLASTLQVDVDELDRKVKAITPPTNSPDNRKNTYIAQNIDEEQIKANALDVIRLALEVKDKAAELSGKLKSGVTELPIRFAITGENMSGLKKVEASVDSSVLIFAELGDGPINNLATKLSGDTVVIAAKLKASAIVHFRLTFELKNPANPATPIKRVLFTPPLILSFNNTVPVAAGNDYFNGINLGMNTTPGGALPDAAPDSLLPPPPFFPATSIPRTATVPFSRTPVTRSLAQRLEPDFSTDLFPPLPEK